MYRIFKKLFFIMSLLIVIREINAMSFHPCSNLFETLPNQAIIQGMLEGNHPWQFFTGKDGNAPYSLIKSTAEYTFLSGKLNKADLEKVSVIEI
jgi:hypothetical protein